MSAAGSLYTTGGTETCQCNRLCNMDGIKCDQEEGECCMKIYIVTDSSTYEKRAELVYRYCTEHGYDAVLIGTAFDHRAKKKREEASGRIYIDAGGYKKNISIERLWYHHKFAKMAHRLLRSMMAEKQAACGSEVKSGSKAGADDIHDWIINAENADILYILLPGNSLAGVGAKLKKEYGCRLIFDIIDLWPESLPIGGAWRTLPVKYWKRLRDDYLKTADHIVTECGLYRELLRLCADKTSIMYWPKQENVKLREGSADGCNTDNEKSVQTMRTDSVGSDNEAAAERSDMRHAPVQSDMTVDAANNSIHIAYLGSINNIIDIQLITELLSYVNKKRHVILNVIGDGESREIFLSSVAAAGIEAHYHGAIFDEAKKQSILQSCEWGINIMKPGVKVGLTMKSVEYMANGLKLINNIPGDTWDLVKAEDIGVNVGAESYEKSDCGIVGSGRSNNEAAAMLYRKQALQEAAEKICSFEGADRKTIHGLFEEKFSVEAMNRVLGRIL